MYNENEKTNKNKILQPIIGSQNVTKTRLHVHAYYVGMSTNAKIGIRIFA